MNIRIVADSTCDLSDELIQKYQITILPLYVTLGETTYRDRVEISAEDIFRYVGSKNELPKTAAVSVAAYAECFEKLRKECDAVICIGISSDFSSCVQNAKIAASDFDEIYVVDSRNLSTGFGHVVLQAAERAAQGMQPAQIISELEQDIIPCVDASFIVDCLDYLHKGGRCSSVAALGANLLKLRPCIEVRDGKMVLTKKYRGKLIQCIQQYVTDRLEDVDNADTERIFVTHSPTDSEVIQMAKDVVAKFNKFDNIIETDAGSTISSHCGPNTLGVLFIRKKQSKVRF